jgi:hypothetical protein
VKKFPLWLTYTLLRLAFFVVPFVVLLLFNISWWIAVIIAALIGLSASYIFLARFRNQMSTAIHEARQKSRSGAKSADEMHEDSVNAEPAATLPSPAARRTAQRSSNKPRRSA